ncbi:hypothetical protein BH09MYX1_BH09MYX1_37760 [soil metagenome]
MKHLIAALALASLTLAACKKPPLVGTFAGTAHITRTGDHLGSAPPSEDVPATIVVATDSSSGQVVYTATFEGGPFVGKCLLKDGLEADSAKETPMLVFGAKDCKASVNGATQVGDASGTLSAKSKDAIDVLVSFTNAEMTFEYRATNVTRTK